MDNMERLRWIKTAVISAATGGVMAAIAAACDPSKYRFPQDLGSGRLWPFFFAGAAAMFGGALLRSPLGQQLMTSYKDSQKQLEESKAELEKAKAELKPPEKKEPGK